MGFYEGGLNFGPWKAICRDPANCKRWEVGGECAANDERCPVAVAERRKAPVDEEMPNRNAAMEALCLKFALWAHQYFSTSQCMRVILLRFGKEGGVSLVGCVGDGGELPLRDTTNSATATIWALGNETGTPSSFPAPPAENSRCIPRSSLSYR